MKRELRKVPANMLSLGLGALTHALRLSFYADFDNGHWGELSVLNAAHAAEILIKARIAAEHPFLVFEELPRSTQTKNANLEFDDLFTKGKTIDYADLPERLWAVTGETVPNLELFKEFGRLRNAIQHFASHPKEDPREKTLGFVFGVIDPFINKQWGLFAIDYNEEMGDHYEHIFDSLVARDIRPLISPDAAEAWSNLGYKPGATAPAGYAKWFEDAMARALPKPRAPKARQKHLLP
ncbi:MAG: hypothetical protein JST54_12150 [Deltaproteobacteria bacterium]|nr:hypothetical protein [Deltaproteobacteria bacterium]